MPIQLDMMTKLIATAIFAGVVAILATVVIERLGGKLGGILATIPTTIVPASFGFWFLSNQPTEFENALWSVPAGMLLNAAFLHSWHWMPKLIMVTHRWLKLCLVIACSLSLWLVLAIMSVIVLERLIDFMPIVGISSLVIQVVYGYMASRAHPPVINCDRCCYFDHRTRSPHTCWRCFCLSCNFPNHYGFRLDFSGRRIPRYCGGSNDARQYFCGGFCAHFNLEFSRPRTRCRLAHRMVFVACLRFISLRQAPRGTQFGQPTLSFPRF